MKNREKWANEIIDISTYSRLAVNKETHKPCECKEVKCENCLLYSLLYSEDTCRTCRGEAQKWLEAEYEPYVDWNKVEVDTKILVSDDNKHWLKRYFAKYELGMVYAWNSGKGSWSAENESDVRYWKYAKFEDENDEK